MSRLTSLVLVAVFAVAFAGCDKKKEQTSEKKEAIKTAAAKPAVTPAKPAEPVKPAATPVKPAEPAAPVTPAKADKVIGKYNIDKEAVKAQMKAAIAQMPKKKQGMAMMMIKLIDMIEMELDLKKGGIVVVKETKPSMGKKGTDKPKAKETKGKWEIKDGKVVITSEGKKAITCEAQGKKLVCSQDKPSPFKMVLKRI